MRWRLLTSPAVLAALIVVACAASATGVGGDAGSSVRAAGGYPGPSGELRGARLETLWIFDADFEDWIGDNAGWTTHDLSEPPGQTGIVFRRGLYGVDLLTGHQFVCDDRSHGSSLYAAVDSLTGRMVNDEHTVLISPAINTEGISVLIGQWDMWVDLPAMTNDVYNLYLASDDLEGSVTEWPGVFVDEDPGWSYGRPRWDVTTDDWTAFAGNDWLGIAWAVRNEEPAAAPHTAGILLNRQRVGFVVGDPGTLFARDRWNGLKDWFRDDLDQALLDDARIWVHDDDGVASVTLLASNDDVVWSAYPCVRESPDGDWWLAPAPSAEMVPESEIHYYYEAVDGVGNAAVYPSTGPDRCFEMSILPSSVGTKILLVDKHNERIPGAERDYGFYDPMGRYKCYSEYYYREALEILGYDWDVYDVEIPSESLESRGPDTTGMKYYQTQIWFTGDRDVNTLTVKDQLALVQWLNQSWMGRERNLLISGNDIGYELMQAGTETLSLFNVWLASDYIMNSVGVVAVDSVPGLEHDAGDFDFMTWDDREACLQGGCPELMYFDVIDVYPGTPPLAEVVADYCKLDGSRCLAWGTTPRWATMSAASMTASISWPTSSRTSG